MLATHVVESVGTQEYENDLTGAVQRLTDAYGAEAASEIAAHLPQFA